MLMRKSVLYIVLLFSLATQAGVFTPSNVPNPKEQGQEFYVTNPDAIIADSDVVWLNHCAKMLEQQTQVEMCVVALGNIGDADCFDFTYELYQRWRIGKKGKNTGVLIVFVLDSHDIRIMTGTGIEGVLTDAQCSQIIRQHMAPAFREGDYGGGLCLGALEIYRICTDGDAPEELLNATSVTNRGGYESKGTAEPPPGWAVCIGFIILALLIYLFWRWGKYNERSSHSGRGGSGRSSRGYSGGSFSGGSWGGGSTSGGGAGGKW